MVDSVFRTSKNYNLQVFLEECIYVVEERKMPEYITDDEEVFSGDSDKEGSDFSNREGFDEEQSFDEEYSPTHFC